MKSTDSLTCYTLAYYLRCFAYIFEEESPYPSANQQSQRDCLVPFYYARPLFFIIITLSSDGIIVISDAHTYAHPI